MIIMCCLYFITVAISCLIIFCIAYMLIALYDYCNCEKGRLKIKFNSFIKFYNVRPEAWLLLDDLVIYRPLKHLSVETSISDSNFVFCFSFLGYIRYKIWKKSNKILKQRKNNAQRYLTVLKYIEADIKSFTEQNNNLIEEEMKKITDRM